MESKCNDTKELINGLPVGIACSRTCGICVEEKLRCSSKLCRNDAVCFNINDESLMENSHIGFKCQCQPGFYGQFCELSKFERGALAFKTEFHKRLLNSCRESM